MDAGKQQTDVAGDSSRKYPHNLQGMLQYCTEHTQSSDLQPVAASTSNIDDEVNIQVSASI